MPFLRPASPPPPPSDCWRLRFGSLADHVCVINDNTEETQTHEQWAWCLVDVTFVIAGVTQLQTAELTRQANNSV